MSRGKMITPPVKGIDLEKSIQMAVKLGSAIAGGNTGLRAVGPVMDGAIAYASEAMLPALAALALLARGHPDRVRPSAEGWRVAVPGDNDPREISLLLSGGGITGGWLVRTLFRTALTEAAGAARADLIANHPLGADTATEVARLMRIDQDLDGDAANHIPAAPYDPVREILIAAVDIQGPPPGARDIHVIPDVCDARSADDGRAMALRIRPQPFMPGSQLPIVGSSKAGQHSGLAALVALSGLIVANGLQHHARSRHAILSGMGWKQFGDDGNACLLGTGMAIIGASEGLCDAAAAARLGRFTTEMIAFDLRRLVPLLPEIAQSLATEHHEDAESAWMMPGGRVGLWLDTATLRIICTTGGARYALPFAADGSGDFVATSGALEVARIRLESDARVRAEPHHVGGGAMPPPIRTVSDVLLGLEVAHRTLGERHRQPSRMPHHA